MTILFTFLLFLLATLATPQSCISQGGQPVAWWVVFKIPPKTGHSGYGYYDSTMKTGSFLYYSNPIDKGTTPLTETFNDINRLNLELMAWNDQKPSGQVSSTHAHAKGVFAYKLNGTASRGLLFSHSIPKYPSFVNEQISPSISDSQNYYGQHLSCFTMTLKELDEIAQMMLITMPFVYKARISDTSSTRNLYKLSLSLFVKNSTIFNKHEFRSPLGYNLKTIYKNNQLNASIFEDGLTNYLTVHPIIAETWGRPLQSPWCSGRFQVYNVNTLQLAGISWTEQDDHSKWAIANNEYACFGDMNRMSSQWKRGGSFFCLSDSSLVSAIKKVIVTHDKC